MSHPTDQVKKKKNFSVLAVFLSVALIISAYFALNGFFSSSDDEFVFSDDAITQQDDSTSEQNPTNEKEHEILKKYASNIPDSILAKDPQYALEAAQKASSYKGRRVNVAITGVDSRLGAAYKHADANHVLSFLLDSGKIEIYSIPRDTPADAGFPDTTIYNILANVYAGRSQKTYLKELGRISGLDSIHYFMELGFSQAIGVMDFLGMKNSTATLQVLRSRKLFNEGDFQRVYNQGQFIRQMLLKHSSKIDGVFGNVLLAGAFTLLETNLTTSKAKSIFETMRKNGFDYANDKITVQLRPKVGNQYKVFDFNNEETLTQLQVKANSYFQKNHSEEASKNKSLDIQAYNRINNIISSTYPDTAKRASQVIRKLSVIYKQRAWHQVRDAEKRNQVRDEIRRLLVNAHLKKNDKAAADEVQKTFEAENQLFNIEKH